MTTAIPEYDVLYSISDLHLGGPPGCRIFAKGERLMRFLRWLAAPCHHARCALVLAGDVIDSLPSLSGASGYIMVDEAADLVTSTLDDFSEVLEGLRTFVSTPDRELVVMVGNHDLELALPEAQEAFCDAVAEKDLARRGRIRFVCDGTGFRCRVGDKLVYVTHGNEADRWNHVDHEALRKVAHRRALGHAFDRAGWSPNAGTKLVVDVMNKVKEKYPFVDLLKPETAATLRVLALLDANRVRDFYAALPAFVRRVWAQTEPMAVLGGQRPVDASTSSEALDLLHESRVLLSHAQHPSHGGALLASVGELHRQGRKPEELVEDGIETLNVVNRVFDLIFEGRSAETMRKALLDWTKNDRSFDLSDIDAVCRGVLSQIGTGIDVVITGHTHLPRWLWPNGKPGLVYLNAGTWARTIGLDSELLGSDTGSAPDKQAFAAAYEALTSPDLASIDAHHLFAGTGRERGLVLDATLAAFVKSTGPEPRVGLARVLGGETVKRDDSVAGQRKDEKTEEANEHRETKLTVTTMTPDDTPLKWTSRITPGKP